MQDVMSKERNQGKESEQGRSRAQNGQVRPLALGLDAQVRSRFLKGDLQLPAQDKPFEDLGWGGAQIGAEQGQGRSRCDL